MVDFIENLNSGNYSLEMNEEPSNLAAYSENAPKNELHNNSEVIFNKVLLNSNGNGTSQQMPINASVGSSTETAVSSASPPKLIELGPRERCTSIISHISSENIDKYETEEKSIQCGICLEIMEWRKELIDHTLNKHKKELEPYFCDCCKKPFVKFQALKRHMSTVHLNPRKFQCTGCSEIFFRRYGAVAHAKRCGVVLAEAIANKTI